MLEFEKVVALSGKSALYSVVGNRNNGLIVQDLDSGKRSFAPSRKYQFTPLDSISIYTTEDPYAIELRDVFKAMMEKKDEGVDLAALSSDADYSDFFASVLPSYDPDRVYVRDMKKAVRWCEFLASRELISAESLVRAEQESGQPEESAEAP